MIQQHIDRSRQTTGGMTASVIAHAGLLLLLTLATGARAVSQAMDRELTEIAYIEARYGEDVASKVKLRRPEPPGRGVGTDSAMKPAEPDSPEPPRPEPKPLTRPELPETTPASRQQVAEAVAPEIVPVTQQPQALAQAPALEARAPTPRSRQVIDASRLRGNPNVKIIDDAGSLARANKRPQGEFKPQEGALRSKAGGVVTGGDVVAAPGSNRSRGVSEAPGAVASGGSLESSSRSTYAAPQSSLAPAGEGGGKAGGKGVLDVDGPTGGGSSGTSGRKTILNYGSGSGGRGGSLAGRSRLAEPEPTSEIVKKAAEPAPKQAVADVKLDSKGVGMTISGQISGRKILKSVVPEYTTKARQKGWEGVVSVHFTVLADGRVKDNMYLEQSSVHRDLNKMAMEALKKFRFAPLPSDQAAVEQWGVITIIFRLN